MTTKEIIQIFRLLTDDDTTLSEDEELLLAEKSYRKILNHHDWEFLKKTFTGQTSGTVPYIDLPADFKRFAWGKEDGEKYIGNAPLILPDEIDSRSGAYLDLANRQIAFTSQPASAQTVRFRYIYRPPKLTLESSPVFDEDYHPMIAHDMVTDYYIADQTPKGRGYYVENMQKYDDLLQRMLMDNELINLQ